MTIGELVDILIEVDRDRMAYVLDIDGTAQPVAHVVDMKHTHLPESICISDDVALMTANTYVQTESIEE